MGTAILDARGTTADGAYERLAEIAARLVRFPTVAADAAATVACLTWVREHALGRAPRLRARRFSSAGVPSLLLWHGDDWPRVLLCGHLDVVEASEPGAFEARRGGRNRLYGRGAADMKGPVAALLDVLEAEQLPGLGLLLTTDEEGGGQHGTKHVLEHLRTPPQVAILPDGGAGMRLVIEQKGVLRLQLVTRGRAAHGSRPWLGANALERLYAGYDDLRRRYPTPEGEEDWRVSLALTALRSVGNSPNTVPQRAEGVLDVRFPAPAGHSGDGDIYARDIARRLERYETTARVALHAPAFRLNLESPCIERLQSIARETLGQPLPTCREAGASDARYFAARGVPTLVFQPRCANWHGAREWVDLASLARFREICARFARETLA